MKNGLLLSAIITTSLLIINSGCAKAANSTDISCDATVDHPCLVQDSDGSDQSVKNYRDGAMLATAYQGDTTGLKERWISGSATPNKQDLLTIAAAIKQASRGQATRIIDLDLREETHGILNGNPITLAIRNDWINVDKPRRQIILNEVEWQTTLLNQKILHDVLTPTQFKSEDFNAGSDVIVNTMQSEKEIAEASGFHYLRLTITDHMAPKPSDVDSFVQLIDKLPANTWLYLHCRGGKGRTTTFLAMADMLHNADKVSFDDIIKRQAAVAPFEDLSQLDNKNPELLKYYQERYEFMKQFYQYANARLHGSHDSWAGWLQAH